MGNGVNWEPVNRTGVEVAVTQVSGVGVKVPVVKATAVAYEDSACAVAEFAGVGCDVTT